MELSCENCRTAIEGEVKRGAKIQLCITCKKSRLINKIEFSVGGNVVGSNIILANGDVITYSLTECRDCLGTGKQHDNCPDCSGKGQIKTYVGPRDNPKNIVEAIFSIIKNNSDVKNEFNYINEDCKRCLGKGLLRIDKIPNLSFRYNYKTHMDNKGDIPLCEVCFGIGEVPIFDKNRP